MRQLANTMEKPAASAELIQVLEDDVEVVQVARDIAESGSQDDAFYILDLGDVVRKFQEWSRRMPRVRTFYAVKCHNNTSVIRALASLGTGFDCASKSEIDQVLGVGVAASRVIFANPAKPASHILHAAALDVHLMTFDNEIELRKMMALDPAVKLVLRFRCDAKGATVSLGEKYGCDPLLDGPRLLRQVRELDGNLVGVSFHAGCNFIEPEVFRRAIVFARGLFDVAETLGIKMTLLDLGGGFPGRKGSSIADISSVINEALDDFFPTSDVDVIAEPGTYYVASAFTLYTQIHSKRVIYNEDEKHIMYYINDGVFSSFVAMLLNVESPTPTPLRTSLGALTASSVWGPTCCGMDCVHKNIALPELDVGDWLEYPNMGAYTRVLATSFNGLPVPRVHGVVNSTDWLALRDKLPMTSEDFVSGYASSTLRLGLDTSSSQHGG